MSGKSIVVGYDASPGARDALVFAVETARLGASPVEVVHAWSPSLPTSRFAPGYSGPGEETLSAAAGAVLAEGLDLVRDSGAGVEVDGVLARGSASTVLLETAERADLLVVGSRGLGGFGGLLLGSTGVQVATHAACPVVVVRPVDPKVEPGPEAGRIVVGVDGSRVSGAALEFALAQATLREVGLTAVLSLDIPVARTSGRPGLSVEDVLLADPEAGDALLSRSVAEWRSKYPDVDVRTRVESGAAARALIRASAGALLLVVGSRGLGGFESLMLGSVGHSVLHHAHGPVAVVHPHTRVP